MPTEDQSEIKISSGGIIITIIRKIITLKKFKVHTAFLEKDHRVAQAEEKGA